MKRLLDFIIALSALLVLLPVIIIVAILVRLKLGSPVLFSQDRPGLHGKVFKMYKFRSMTDDRDDNGELLSNEVRMTKFGKLLRSTSLDELPGLFNVIKGDMSLVGPRPLLVQYLPLYNKEQARRHDVRPGITGWAQVNGRNTISWEQKFTLDVWYVDNQSLWLDFKILLLTVKKVLIRSGINSSENVTMSKFKGTDNESKPLIIIGASGFGKEVAWLAKRLGFNILGFLDDNESLTGKIFYNFPVLGVIDDWVNYPTAEFALAIASPRVRKIIVNKMLLAGEPMFKTLIDPSVEVDKEETEIGKGSIICAGSICTANVKIGNFSIINKQCSIGHDVIINDFCTVAPKVMLGGHVHLHDGVEIGASSSIRQQLTVEKGASIGMGSVVVKPVEANTLYLGAPAKKVKALTLFN